MSEVQAANYLGQGGRVKESYAWIITNDFIAEPGKPAGSYSNAVGITGPNFAPKNLIEQLKNGDGESFLVLDDDGNLYYAGRCLSTRGWGGEEFFGPLWDFGRPNSGAVSIFYLIDGTWEEL